MLLRKISFFLILLTQVKWNDGLRALVFFPMVSKSHSILGQGVVSRLLESGHEVVHITSFPRKEVVPNLKEIDVSTIAQRFLSQSNGRFDAFKLKNLIGKSSAGDSMVFLYFAHDIQRQTLEEKKVQDLLTDKNEHFDVVIVEWFFSEIAAGLAPLFNCPLIWFGSTEAHWQMLEIIDEIPNTSYNVDLFSHSRPPLSFFERSMELWVMIKKYVMVNLLITPFEKSAYNSVFPKLGAARGVAMPSYKEAIYNGSLMLLNSHPTIGTPYRLPQNAKYVAGYHIDKEAKPLPKDLQIIMDEARHGVIYFSMGSNLKSADMSEEMKQSFIKMFSQLNQTVIWKYEKELANVSSNVHLVKWAPQFSILSHPNLKLFVTHGGQLSTTEAIHLGVPIVGIPVMADQYVNMRSVTQKGLGRLVKISEDMAPKLKIAIEDVLRNPIYTQRAKELSQMYHDRILPPGEELVYWVEHVARTKGAPHLRSMALNVPLYKKMYLDLVIVLLPTLYFLITVLKNIKRKYCHKYAKMKDN